MFEPLLCRIRSELKLVIASKDPSFNNCVHNKNLDLYITHNNKTYISLTYYLQLQIPLKLANWHYESLTFSAKLHGDYLGPFLITEIVSNSSVNIMNFCADTIVQASVKHLAPWQSSLPANDEFHSWVAAGDVEERIIEKILSQEWLLLPSEMARKERS
ncbi:hypothetical protein P9112_010287 [Eukaryota sp. TZLM1-RC]